MADPIVIVGAARTPMGGFQGVFAPLAAPRLGSVAIRAAVERAGIAAEGVEEVLLGCVLQAGQGQAPARQAALLAGLPLAAGCTTINKVCGSAMQAVVLGHDGILAGSCKVAVAGGMESMTNAPYLLPRARGGYRLGHGRIIDHLFLDGLEDAYGPEHRGCLMGTFAEEHAERLGFSREAQDEFALRSTRRARQAQADGSFDWEIAPVTVPGKGGERIIRTDEPPARADPDRIPTLKPAFKENGTVTPASSSAIADGAAALVLMAASRAEALGLAPIACIRGHAAHAGAPADFPIAPVGAIRKLLARTGWTADQVDLYEINEAFAVVTMAAMAELALPAGKVNIHGGACALGHPIGASGARIVVTLLGALRKYGLKRGVAALCIGGGEAMALAVEML